MPLFSAGSVATTGMQPETATAGVQALDWAPEYCAWSAGH